MTVITIVITDLTNPIELQIWLTNNPDITISRMFLQQNICTILY